MTQQNFDRLIKALEKIAGCLEVVTDRKNRTLRMNDVDRAKVYKTHLDYNLRSRQNVRCLRCRDNLLYSCA